jgi:hypothetical protein
MGMYLKNKGVKKNGDMYSSFKDNLKEVTKLSSFSIQYLKGRFGLCRLSIGLLFYEPNCLQYGGTMLLLVTFWPITTAASGKLFLMLTILAFLMFNYQTLALRAFEIIRKFVLKIFSPLWFHTPTALLANIGKTSTCHS